MGENFAFFLPVMMASFGTAFLFIWSYRLPVAGWWSAGFFSVAAAFAVPFAAAILPSRFWSLLADALFASGFLLFGEALLQRWRPGWQLSTRVAIWALSILLCTLAVAFDKLALELAASDFGCFLLIAIPLIAGRRQLRGPADRLLFCAAALAALDNFVRGSTVPLTTSGSGDFFATDYAYLMQGLACIFGLFLALSALATQVSDLLSRYQREAMIDPLSALLNRRGFDDAVDRLTSASSGSGSLIVCDIDHFKAVNDEFGHALGDRVISALASLIRQVSPSQAMAARFGGEEFVIYLPQTNAARAAEIAEEVRVRFAREVHGQLGLTRSLTASFGLSTDHGDSSIHDVIARADEALYEAKARGRDRVCVRRALSSPICAHPPAAPSAPDTKKGRQQRPFSILTRYQPITCGWACPGRPWRLP